MTAGESLVEAGKQARMEKSRRSPEALEMLLMSLLATNGELSGYQIATILRDPVPFIWPVKHSQIYPALAKLDQAGFVSGQWIEQTGRPDKKSYRLSEDGSERLKTWLLVARESYSTEEIVLVTYNVDLVGFEEVRRALSVFRQQCEAEKAELEQRWALAIRKGAEHGTLLDLHVPQWIGVRAAYEFGIMTREGRIAWCDTALSRAEAVIAIALTREAARRRDEAAGPPGHANSNI